MGFALVVVAIWAVAGSALLAIVALSGPSPRISLGEDSYVLHLLSADFRSAGNGLGSFVKSPSYSEFSNALNWSAMGSSAVYWASSKPLGFPSGPVLNLTVRNMNCGVGGLEGAYSHFRADPANSTSFFSPNGFFPQMAESYRALGDLLSIIRSDGTDPTIQLGTANTTAVRGLAGHIYDLAYPYAYRIACYA